VATATSILDNIRLRFGDASANFITSTLGVSWLNKALEETVLSLMPLRRLKGTDVATNQEAFSIPSDAIMMELVYHAKSQRRLVSRRGRDEFFARKQQIDNALSDYPTIWTEFEDKVYVWPRYSGKSSTTAASGAITSTSSTVSVATTSSLQSTGRVKINSEEMEYTNVSTGNIKGVTRGVGGTSAASHASGDTVTQMDLLMLYRRQHASIGTGGETVDIPPYLQPMLEDYALYLAFMAEGSRERGKEQYELYRAKLEQAEYAAKREHLGPLQVRNVL